MASPFDPPSAAEAARLRRGLARAPDAAARFLLGQRLVRRAGSSRLSARIVEVEAYFGRDDPAAHAFRGRTARNAPLWGPPGTIYIYFIYGLHHCLNLAVQPAGVPGCVLVRAAEPQGTLPAGALRGPGRLCRALGLDRRFSGDDLFAPDAPLVLREGPPPRRIGVSTRVGIRLAAERPLRFFDADSDEVSRGPAPLRVEEGPPGRVRKRC